MSVRARSLGWTARVSVRDRASATGILTGADLIVQALEDAGVEVAFGLPGVHNLALWSAMGRSPIRLVGVRHEQTAAYAADGYARAGGRLGVALTTTGPGAANTLAAVGEAWASRSPVLVIATDVPTTVRRRGTWRGALHEATDQAAMFAPVVKHVERSGSPAGLGAAVAAAARAALDPPARPAYLEVPTDLLAAEVDSPRRRPPDRRRSRRRTRRWRVRPSSSPPHGALVWAGGGALQAGAGTAVAALAERLVAPVVLTYSARGLLARGHPCLVAAPSPCTAGRRALGRRRLRAGDWDRLRRDDDPGLDAARAALLAVNVDAGDAAKNYLPDLVIEADAAQAVPALAARLAPRGGLGALARRLTALQREVRAELERGDPDALAFLDGVAAAVPEAGVVVRHVHPRLLARRLPSARDTARALVSARLGHARLRLSPGARRGTGRGGAGREHVRRRRVPLRARRTGDGGAGADPADGRGGRRRRLRDAALRPGPARRPTRGGRPRRTSRLWPPPSACAPETVDGLGADFAAALERQLALAEPSVLVARAGLRPPPNVSPRWYRRGGT